MRLTLENAIRAAFGLGLVFLLLTSGAAYWSASRSVANLQKVERSERTLELLHEALTSMLDVETASRGFALTGDKTFLEPFDRGRTQIPQLTADLRGAAAGRDPQLSQLDRLDALISAEMLSASNLIELKSSPGTTAAATVAAATAGRETMDTIRRLIREMELAEQRHLDRRADDAHHTFRITAAIIAISGLLAVLVVGIASCVAHAGFSRRRRAEAERDGFFSLTRDLVCFAGFDGYFKTVNPAWEKVLGYSREELMNRPFVEFVHPDDRDATMAEAGKLQQGEDSIEFENRYRARDGSYRWLSWNARSSAAQGLIYATARDVTEQKRALEQIARLNADLQERARKLQQSEERFRLMVDAIKDYAVFRLNTSGLVESWNTGAERIKGYSATEILGQHFSRFYTEEDLKSGKAETALRIAEQEGRFEDTGWRVRKDGSRFWANVVLSPVRDDAGQLLGYVKVTRDITERKRSEEKLNALTAELQQRAAQLEAANKELESFSYSVSHDLRAPLRHIGGFVSRLEHHAGQTLDDKSRRYLGIISDSARQMGQLIDDLLVFSRMGRTEMQQRPVDLEQLLVQVMATFEEETRARNIRWKNGNLPEVQGDPSMLRQVFLNLLGNSVKYTRRRKQPEIEIGCSETPEEFVVFIRDNGAGFDMEYASKLFGVFQRLHRSDEFEGTGIGLANVRRIIHRHGGRTWAEGKVDRGAIFYFSLPRHQKEKV